MTVTLSKRAEAIVRAQLQTGRFATPDEVVNYLIEKHATAAAAQPECPTDAELKASLVAAVNKPMHPYRAGEFVELARQIVG